MRRYCSQLWEQLVQDISNRCSSNRHNHSHNRNCLIQEIRESTLVLKVDLVLVLELPITIAKFQGKTEYPTVTTATTMISPRSYHSHLKSWNQRSLYGILSFFQTSSQQRSKTSIRQVSIHHSLNHLSNYNHNNNHYNNNHYNNNKVLDSIGSSNHSNKSTQR